MIHTEAVVAVALLAQFVFNVSVSLRLRRFRRVLARRIRREFAQQERVAKPFPSPDEPYIQEPRPEPKAAPRRARFEPAPYADPESRLDEKEAYFEDLKMERYERN